VDSLADSRPLVLHLVYRFAVGGLENGIVNLINHMPAARWRHVVVALTTVDAAFVQRIRRDDVQCIALNKPPGQGVWQYRRLYRLFRQWRPAVVHTRNLGTLEFQLPAWLAGVPARVHSEHGRDAEDVDGTNRRHIWTRRAYSRFVQHQIALGSELARYLRDTIALPAARLTPILNGVDHLRFAPAPRRAAIAGSPFDDPALWLVGTVGRMQTVKAQPVLARAFVDVLQRLPALRRHLRLVMVGDGPLRSECEAVLRDAGVADLAWLPGERSDVPEIMRGLDCFVLPSLVEGISNTILEAMASGLPVLATQVGGNADLVEPGVTGELVPAGDVAALSAGLARMAGDPGRSRVMGAAGRRSVERSFSLPAMVAAYERVYDGLLRRGNQE
jgi:sugar transferase (PEP-CTERM/EpsH1 system associated)